MGYCVQTVTESCRCWSFNSLVSLQRMRCSQTVIHTHFIYHQGRVAVYQVSDFCQVEQPVVHFLCQLSNCPGADCSALSRSISSWVETLSGTLRGFLMHEVYSIHLLFLALIISFTVLHHSATLFKVVCRHSSINSPQFSCGMYREQYHLHVYIIILTYSPMHSTRELI